MLEHKGNLAMNDKVSTQSIQELYSMLRTCRPHGSRAELEFSKEYLLPLGVTFDSFGNSWKKIGTAPIAYSAHVDTAHSLGGTQSITRDDKYVIKLHKNSTSNCLGADDTAGVWLMVEMIKAERPGLYLFHRGEECGGKGSDFISKHTKHLVEGMKFMVAFDRKDYDSIITHQWGGRCCSDEFGSSLAYQLGERYKLDKSGSFTDSANYTNLVAECANVSVGYKHQHTVREELSMSHLVDLRSALMHLDVDKLVVKRKPGEKVYNKWNRDEYGGMYDDWYGGGYWDSDLRKWVSCSRAEWLDHMKGTKSAKDTVVALPMSEERMMAAFITAHADKVAVILLDWGFDIDQVKLCMASSVAAANKAEEEQEKRPM